MELDFSGGSLEVLAGVVRERLADPVEALYHDEQGFTAGVVAYVGEVLLRVGGGCWGWVAEALAEVRVADALLGERLAGHRWRIDSGGEPDAAGFAVVCPDPVTGLAVVSPLHLLLAELGDGGGAGWVDTWRRWRVAVDSYGAAHPGWAPVKEPTLADGVFAVPAPSAVLDEWLDGQRRHFGGWVARYGGGWDYSPDSIDRLTALVTRVTPTVAAFCDPANAGFVEAASYYLGETLCRGFPSRWVYSEALRDAGDPVTANFEIQTNDNMAVSTPYHLLRRMLRLGDPGRTRAYYEQWTAEKGYRNGEHRVLVGVAAGGGRAAGVAVGAAGAGRRRSRAGVGLRRR